MQTNSSRSLLLGILLFGVLFNFFFANSAGLNWSTPLLITCTLLTSVSFYYHGRPQSRFSYFVLGLWFLAAIACLLTNTLYSQTVLVIITLLQSAWPHVASPTLVDYLYSAARKLEPSFLVPNSDLQKPDYGNDSIESDTETTESKRKERRETNKRNLTTGVVVGGIVGLFLIFYSSAIPYFGDYLYRFFNFLGNLLPDLEFLDFVRTGLGALIAIYCWRYLRTTAIFSFSQEDLKPSDEARETNGVELQRGLILLALLIPVIIVALFLDIRFIWFSGNQVGTYDELQTAVRTGTAGLIISIICSLFIALFFFRGDLNFESGKRARWLKKLTFIWLGLNLIMCLSVLIRTGIYIQHYNLAYKRFGVLFFCVAAFYGILLTYAKIQLKKNGLYYIRHLFNVGTTLLILMGFINFDKVILRYNFNHPEAYLDLDYLYSRNLDAVLEYGLVDDFKDAEIKGSPNHKWLKADYGRIPYPELIRKRVNSWKKAQENADWRNACLRDNRIRELVNSDRYKEWINPPPHNLPVQEPDHIPYK